MPGLPCKELMPLWLPAQHHPPKNTPHFTRQHQHHWPVCKLYTLSLYVSNGRGDVAAKKEFIEGSRDRLFFF